MCQHGEREDTKIRNFMSFPLRLRAFVADQLSFFILTLAFTLIVCTSSRTSFSEEPITGPEMQKISEKIWGQYSHNVFIVNAWSKVTGDTNGNKMPAAPNTKRGEKDTTIRWRRKIGTAFTLSECGYLITTLCVVNNAERISVVPRSGDEVDAQIVGSDEHWKIAVLKINDPETLVTLPVAPRNSIDKGNPVVLLGFPQDNSLTAQLGTINDILPGDGTLVVSVSGKPGTTGTPVFNTSAQLLGILTYHLHREDMPENTIEQGKEVYLVIPMDYTMIVARSIINNTERNKGWLGVRINLVDSDNTTDGVVIQHIVDNSPAFRCGLKVLDRITEFNGSPIKTIHEMCEAASKTSIGDTVTIKVFRDDTMLTFNVPLAEPPQIR